MHNIVVRNRIISLLLDQLGIVNNPSLIATLLK